jgi:imidazole glycerol phosphate synthase subunit HisF
LGKRSGTERGREILFTSMDNDGTKNGFANEALSKLSSVVNIPIIASGGAGNIQLVDSFTVGKADAALAASVFHFKEIEIKALKQHLKTIILKLEYRGARFEVLKSKFKSTLLFYNL